MGSTNKTVRYGLPQFIDTDKPTWRGDVNGAFSVIDTEIGKVQDQMNAQGVVIQSVTEGSKLIERIRERDGSGSGLDADMLDSRHATDFALAADHVSLGKTVSDLLNTTSSQANSLSALNTKTVANESAISSLNNASAAFTGARQVMSAPWQEVTTLSTWTPVNYNNTEYDDSSYVANPNRFRIPADGRYIITASIRLGNASDERRQFLMRLTNGAELCQQTTDTNFGAASISWVGQLNVGNVVEVVLNTPSPVMVQTPSHFAIQRIK